MPKNIFVLGLTINNIELMDTYQVFPKLFSVMKIPTLAVKLAKESFIG